MRGKASSWIKEGTENRITPAYAGKREVFGYQEAWAEDHPRVCGEKLCVHNYLVASEGITPAYAGKSRPVVGCSPLCRDHPRVCGEKQAASRQATTRLGSPPRMRGKD